MAIKWIDPYIDAPIDGIHGTTNGTTQNGTYNFPFPLSTSSSAGSATKTGLGLSNGDEVRIKGLAVDTFWGSSVAFASVSINSGNAAYIERYNVNAAHSNKWCRIKTIQTERFLYLQAYSGYFNTSYYGGAWVTQIPYLNQTFASQLLDTDYELPNSTTCYLCTSGFSAGDDITITAGWVDESTQGGETILATANKSFIPYMGQNGFTTDDAGHPLTIDAPELSFLTSNGYIYGNDITLRTLSGYEAANYPSQVHATGNATIQQYTASWSTGYLRLYNYQSGGPAQSVLDVAFISPQFYGDIIFVTTDKSTASARWKFKIKEFHSGYGPTINFAAGVPGGGHTLDLEVKANYLLATKGSRITFSDLTKLGTYSITGSGLTNEMSWYASAYVGEEIFLGKDSAAAANTSAITASTASNPEVTTSPFLQVSFGGERAVFLAQLLNGSTSLETMDTSLGTISVSRAYGSPAKVTILADEQGDKPCQLMFSSNSTTTAYPVVVFRSSSFSDKVTWHFTQYTNAGVYADTFAIDLPSYGSDLTFSAAFTTSSTPGVTIKAQLYTANASGAITAYGLQTASVDGTAATISVTVTSSALTSAGAKSAYVIVEMTKTSTAVANVSINSTGLA